MKNSLIEIPFKVPNIRVANESRELILNCCTEFIHLISSEANEICNQKNKKTISAEHILEALDKLGENH
jgi:down-regulator of transcription 1